jgi:PAS domain-containing protein
MPNNQSKDELSDRIKRVVESRTRQAMRRNQADDRRQWRQKDPLRGLFWGFLLVLLGVLFFANEQKWLVEGRWWEALVIGIGSIFCIDAFFHYLNPVARPYTPGRLTPGIILLAVGIVLVVGFSSWWPLSIALIASGAALFFSSWVLQREIEKRTSTQVTLQQSEIRYRQIIDNANSLILEMDTRGNITFINKFAREFFGYKGRRNPGTQCPGYNYR